MHSLSQFNYYIVNTEPSKQITAHAWHDRHLNKLISVLNSFCRNLVNWECEWNNQTQQRQI